MAETVIYDPSNQGMNNALPWMLAGNNGFGNMGGWGGGILGFLLGLFFGNGWGGFGGFGGYGGNSGAGFLSNQINNDSGRELLMNAINSNGEASRAAVQNLATLLGQDFNLVNAGVQTIQTALSNLALQQAVSVPQIVNAIQSGDAALSASLCECCCKTQQNIITQGYENRIQTIDQTNALSTAINSASQRNTDAVADLKAAMIQSFCDVKEREMQAKIDTQADIIGQLRSAADNANQTNQIMGYVNSVVSPIATKVNEIAAKQLPTVPVVYPNIQAVNNSPYNGSIFACYGYGYGVPGGSYWG